MGSLTSLFWFIVRPNTYAFGYEIDDPQTQNIQFRDERRFVNGSVQGSYGYVRPDGLIEVTKYRADENGGFLAQTQSFQPGDEQAKTVWPTQRPEIIADRQKVQSPTNVTWDPKSHLNVSVSHVAADVAKQLKEQHGLDLNHIDVAKDVLKPAVLDVVQGKAPLNNKTKEGTPFQPVQNVIPNRFPIFMLPADTDPIKATTEEPAANSNPKYNRAKTNNAEKAPQVEVPESGLLPPRPLVNEPPSDANWYQRIIDANRREFLANLPNLNKANT
ncbi:GL24693 [Drosophila persimilis]|uniref:GL24693 n=1 Tax=Drosophila persimilis TaxID=7234 RepID=B4H620_DROPE|nr:GL24693 [Drosophila persimilis]